MKDYISVSLAIIINLSFVKGVCPEHFKAADIVPIYKAGDAKKTTNYRPISLISNLAKIYEKILKKRLVDYLLKNKLIDKKQFGFIKGKNTTQAILSVTDFLYKNLDLSKPIVLILIDLAKAFDTVNKKILLKKMFDFGIRGVTQELFDSYLTNRRQRVRLNNIYSDDLLINIGVPQGSVLGPILFLIYINEILTLIDRIVAFADDTALMHTGNGWKEVFQEIENMLNFLYVWCCKNELSLNIDKTCYIAFSNYADKLPINCKIQIHVPNCQRNNCNCKELNRVESAKYLGIILDQHLKWGPQIAYVVNKTRYLLFIFYTLRRIFSREVLVQIYYALFNSRATYGILAWGSAYNNNLRPLLKLQDKILKVIVDGKNIEYGLLKLFDSFKFQSLLYNYEWLREKWGESISVTRNKAIELEISSINR